MTDHPVPGLPGSSRLGPTRRSFLITTATLGLGTALAGRSAGAGQGRALAGAPNQGGTLRVGTPPPPTGVDPVTMYDGSAIGIVQLVADYLIWLDSDFNLVPRLASSWSSEQGNTVWAFRIRTDVVFSDGTPLDPGAVKASFDRLLAPSNKSPALSAFKGVLSAGGVSVRGDDTVVFTLDRAFSDFPYLVSASNYNSVILKSDYAGEFTKHAIGTGPFLLSSYDPSTGAELTRNPKYWQPGKPHLDEVKVRFYADSQAQQSDLLNGKLDALILTDPSLNLPPGDVVLDKVPSTTLATFTLRVDRPPFDKKEVRQAIAYGLDRPAVNQGVNNGIGQLGNDHLFAPLFKAAPTDLPQRAKDPDKVKQLLSTAGVDKLTFPLTYDPQNKAYALVIQDQLKQVGIEITLDERSSAEFYGGDQTKDTPWLFSDANLVAWAGRPVPSQLITPMVTSNGVWNGSKYANPAVDTAQAAYDAATTDDERRKQASVISSALHEDVPVIISVWYGAVRAYNKKKFTGIRAHPSYFVDFTEVSRL